MNDEIKITILIDPELAELIPEYLENRRKDASTIEVALMQFDFGTIQALAHNMKGTGGGYGFDGITEIGALLEKAAIARDPNAIAQQLEQFRDYLRRIEIKYE
jgi:HPt (histidine-containing phosphotransfer) domain-containing protein